MGNSHSKNIARSPLYYENNNLSNLHSHSFYSNPIITNFDPPKPNIKTYILPCKCNYCVQNRIPNKSIQMILDQFENFSQCFIFNFAKSTTSYTEASQLFKRYIDYVFNMIKITPMPLESNKNIYYLHSNIEHHFLNGCTGSLYSISGFNHYPGIDSNEEILVHFYLVYDNENNREFEKIYLKSNNINKLQITFSSQCTIHVGLFILRNKHHIFNLWNTNVWKNHKADRLYSLLHLKSPIYPNLKTIELQIPKIQLKNFIISKDTCIICQDNFVSLQFIRKLKCFHIFHSQCIDHWILNQSNSCPCCSHSVIN